MDEAAPIELTRSGREGPVPFLTRYRTLVTTLWRRREGVTLFKGLKAIGPKVAKGTA